MLADFDDLRFTKADGTTLLDAWLESKINSTSAVVWVETDTPANTVEADIYMYYGNSGASSSWSGSGTFPELFDDFEDGNVVGWTLEGTQTFEAQSSVVKEGTYSARQTDSSTLSEEAYTTFSAIDEKVIEFDFRVPSTATQSIIAIEVAGGTITNAIQIQFVNDNNIKYYDGSFHTLQAYSIDTWYKFRIVTHAASDTFDIEIDGVSKGTGLGTRGDCTGNFTAFSTCGNIAGTNSYLDNLFIAKYVANPATYGFGSEEDGFIPRIMIF